MQCPVCQTDNPPTAVTCEKCSTPFPLSEATLAPTGVGTEAWSVAVTQSTATETAAKGQLQPGTIIGERYEIQQLLGQGGMGAVYKARDIELERLVALKLIRPDLASHPEILRRFKQELILAREVTHRNVIRIFDLGQAHGVRFITMEYVEGRDLRALLHQKGKLTPEEAVPIFVQIAAALEAAHHAGVVHRDLKPQNVMVDKDGRVYVMDFGVARSLETPGMTQTGALMGTPEYMSPEQAKGQKVDARSDLFSLGIIFYETLSGVSPFKAETAMATMFKRTKERAVPVAQATSGVPVFLSDIVSKCLEIDTAQRYQSAREIITDLEKWQSGVAKSAMNPLERWWKYAPKQQKWLAAGIAAALLLTAAYPLLSKLPLPFSSKPSAAIQPISLAILPFHNASTDLSIDWLGPSLAEMLRTDVGQSASLRTISSDRLDQVLKDLRIPQNAEFDPSTLKRLAEFSSADMLVWGRYVKLGDQIRIDATLLDQKNQRSIPLKAEAPSEKQLLQSVAQLAQDIQKNLALPSDVLKDLRSKSFRPSSDSVEALRNYNEGMQLVRNGNNLEAAKRFEAAVQQDPQFALAYTRLALAYSGLGYGDKAEQFSRKASDLAERLPPQEKYLIQANHARITKNNAKAIEAYENLAKASPDDPDVQFALGELYVETGAFDKARPEFAKVLSRDPKQVEALYDAGKVELLSGNPPGGLDFFNRALGPAVQLGNDEEKAKILQGIGITYRLLNKLDDAMRSYQESLTINRRLGKKYGMAASLMEIALIQRSMGKPDAALASYNEALQLSREIGDKQGTSADLVGLGLLYDDRGQYDQALKLFKESLQLERDADDETSQAAILNNIGHTYFLMGDFDNARTYFEQALGLYEKFKNTVEIADTVHNLAEISLMIGEYDQAQRQYLRALELRRSSEDKRSAAMESSSLGTLFEYQGRYGAELASEEEAVKAFRDAQDRSFWMATVLSGYGHALSQVGRYDEGQKNLEEALTLGRELKNQSLIAQTLNYQGDSFFYRGEFKSARPVYNQALQEASRSKDRNIVLLSKINLAILAVHEGRSQTAAATLKSLAQEADTLGLKYLSAQCSLYRGEALLAARQYSPARQELESALRKSEKLGLKALLAQAHYLLAQALQASANAGEAAPHLGEARRLLEEIRTESHSDAVLKREDLRRISGDASGKS